MVEQHVPRTYWTHQNVVLFPMSTQPRQLVQIEGWNSLSWEWDPINGSDKGREKKGWYTSATGLFIVLRYQSHFRIDQSIHLPPSLSGIHLLLLTLNLPCPSQLCLQSQPAFRKMFAETGSLLLLSCLVGKRKINVNWKGYVKTYSLIFQLRTWARKLGQACPSGRHNTIQKTFVGHWLINKFLHCSY